MYLRWMDMGTKAHFAACGIRRDFFQTEKGMADLYSIYYTDSGSDCYRYGIHGCLPDDYEIADIKSVGFRNYSFTPLIICGILIKDKEGCVFH